MQIDQVRAIQAHPKYRKLVRRRTLVSLTLTVLIIVAYFSYVGLIAFDKPALAKPFSSGVTSWGIPVGIGLIVFTVVLTAIYVAVANSSFDRLTRDLREEVGE